MNDKPEQLAKQWLDQRSTQLGKKHIAALKDMTDEALSSNEKKYFFSLYKPAMAVAFSVLLVMGVMYNFQHRSHLDSEPQMVELPKWVTDTQVPVPVIEQLQFYTWLAQQIEDNDELLHTISKNQTAETGIDRVFKFGYRQQLAALDAPQRLFGEFNVIRNAE